LNHKKLIFASTIPEFQIFKDCKFWSRLNKVIEVSFVLGYGMDGLKKKKKEKTTSLGFSNLEDIYFG